MGRPNYPCIQLSSPYSKYVERGPEATINPYDIDYFVLPDENAPCPPYNKTIYELNLPTKTLSPSFIKVSDISISSVGCLPFYIELDDSIFPIKSRPLFEISGSGLYFNMYGVPNPMDGQAPSSYLHIPAWPWTWLISQGYSANYSIHIVTKSLTGSIVDVDEFTVTMTCS